MWSRLLSSYGPDGQHDTDACLSCFHEVFAELTGCKIWWMTKQISREHWSPPTVV